MFMVQKSKKVSKELQQKNKTKNISECAPGFELIVGDIGGRGPLGYLENVHKAHRKFSRGFKR